LGLKYLNLSKVLKIFFFFFSCKIIFIQPNYNNRNKISIFLYFFTISVWTQKLIFYFPIQKVQPSVVNIGIKSFITIRCNHLSECSRSKFVLNFSLISKQMPSGLNSKTREEEMTMKIFCILLAQAGLVCSYLKYRRGSDGSDRA
jgi:hypothetical protein